MKIKESSYSLADSRREKILTLLFLDAVLGIIFGTLLFCRTGSRELLMRDFFSNGFIKTAGTESLKDVFMTSFSWLSAILIFLFAAGFSSVFQPAEIMTLFYRGMTIGISASYSYAEFGKYGVKIIFLLILPYAAASTAILVLAVRESLRLSNMSLMYISGHASADKESKIIKLYFIRFFVLFLLSLLLSAADCACAFFLADKLKM